MEGMTKILNSSSPSCNKKNRSSLNTIVRRKEMERVNFENQVSFCAILHHWRQLLFDRLHKAKSTISNEEFEESFKHHMKVRTDLQKRNFRLNYLRQMEEEAKERYEASHEFEDTNRGYHPNQIDASMLGSSILNDTDTGKLLQEYESSGNIFQSSPLMEVRRKIMSTKKNTAMQRISKTEDVNKGLYELVNDPDDI